jgi:hypothetical protein
MKTSSEWYVPLKTLGIDSFIALLGSPPGQHTMVT